MPKPKTLSEFATQPVVATEPPKVECASCGSNYPTEKDGYCFDCRIPNWTDEEAIAHKRFGPAIIGKAAYELALSVGERTGDGKFGPALLGQLPDAYKDMRPKDAA